MNTLKRTAALPAALALVGLLCAGGRTASARLASQVDYTSVDDGGQLEQLEDAYDCSCVERYHGGAEASVVSCDAADVQDRCADVDVLIDCREDPDGPDCDYLLSCECECTALLPTSETWFAHGSSDDVFLTGIPDLWQFNFMCGSTLANANAVGCGPVAAAMLLYWYAQQGYEELVAPFVTSSRFGPPDEIHLWQSLVRELREHYLNGGICVPFGGGLYATMVGQMTTGIRDYVADAGYGAEVEHWKVCDDCNAGAANELVRSEALDLIKSELRAGRPVIMGFNAGRAFEAFVPLFEDSSYENVYVGELSNGTPVAGTIDHYAVITGYRQLQGVDVLTLNLGGYDGATDHHVAWNPAGKWLHLYTVRMTSQPDGDAWCTIDEGVDETFEIPSHVELSHSDRTTPSTTLDLTTLAGTSCGIAREGEYQTETYRRTTRQREACPTAGILPTEVDLPDRGSSGDSGTRDDQLSGGGTEPLDQIDPLP